MGKLRGLNDDKINGVSAQYVCREQKGSHDSIVKQSMPSPVGLGVDSQIQIFTLLTVASARQRAQYAFFAQTRTARRRFESQPIRTWPSTQSGPSFLGGCLDAWSWDFGTRGTVRAQNVWRVSTISLATKSHENLRHDRYRRFSLKG